MPHLLQLVYVSTAAKGLPHDAIEAILTASRTRNAAADLTGILLYADRSFIQVLEGPESNVDEVFSRIKKDPRHTGVMVLLRRSVAARNFQAWSMGFERVERDQYPDLDGVFRIGARTIESRLTEAEGLEVMTILRTFYNVTTRETI